MLTDLAQFDGDRRQALASGAYSLALLTVPEWLTAAHRAGELSSKAGAWGRSRSAQPAVRRLLAHAATV